MKSCWLVSTRIIPSFPLNNCINIATIYPLCLSISIYLYEYRYHLSVMPIDINLSIRISLPSVRYAYRYQFIYTNIDTMCPQYAAKCARLALQSCRMRSSDIHTLGQVRPREQQGGFSLHFFFYLFFFNLWMLFVPFEMYYWLDYWLFTTDFNLFCDRFCNFYNVVTNRQTDQ